MDANRFDRISKLFAGRRRSDQASPRPQGEATPAAMDQPRGDAELLFVQTFRAGAVAPKEGTAGRFTLTLEGGHGQTVYFSDRPDRRVGTTPTDRFLNLLGFPDDNPPNAALVVETAPGETDVAVIELFAPIYDEATGGVTYEVEVLENWEAELGSSPPGRAGRPGGAGAQLRRCPPLHRRILRLPRWRHRVQGQRDGGGPWHDPGLVVRQLLLPHPHV